MTEQGNEPVEPVGQVATPTVADAEIEKATAQVQEQDNAVLDALKQELQSQFDSKLTEIKTMNDKLLEKNKEFEEKINGLEGRKGIVTNSDPTPPKPVEAQATPQADYTNAEKIEVIKSGKIDSRADYEASQLFLDSLRK